MISLICCELVRIKPIDSTDFCTALPPSSASWLASLATLLACEAFSFTASTDRVNSSIEADICFDARTLGLRSGGQGLRTFGDDPRPFGELVRALGDLGDHARQVFQHFLDAGGQFIDRLVAFDGDLLGEIALRGGTDDVQKVIDLAAQLLGGQPFGFGSRVFPGGFFFHLPMFGQGALPLLFRFFGLAPPHFLGLPPLFLGALG